MFLGVEEAGSKPLGSGLCMLLSCPSVWTSIQSGLLRPKTFADYLPVGFRVTDRASLAGNVSFSSSSSRWSAQCQSALSGIGLVTAVLFRAALPLEDRGWLAE